MVGHGGGGGSGGSARSHEGGRREEGGMVVVMVVDALPKGEGRTGGMWEGFRSAFEALATAVLVQ